MHNTQSVLSINARYFQKFLSLNNITSTKVGDLCKIDGFTGYNNLIDLNSIFSNHPKHFPIDRTGLTISPVKWSHVRPWVVPSKKNTLDEAMSARVKYFESFDKKINIFWSGGIDSTAIVTAFLKNATDLSKIRIIHSPWSFYEHPEYREFLKKFPQIELIDQSGETYLNLNLDGIVVSGNSGDEIHASIDESFLNTYGFESLLLNWQDFFYKKNNNDEFIEFCDLFFSKSGFKISTVLEARWWFYTSCKISSILRTHTYPFMLSNKTFSVDINDVYGFYDCEEYESFIYWNIHDIMKTPNYTTWKQLLKDYCYKFDKLLNWWETKAKFASLQLTHYEFKKVALNDKRHILILGDGSKIQTPNLPFFSKKEFLNIYGDSLEYLLNEPDKL